EAVRRTRPGTESNASHEAACLFQAREEKSFYLVHCLSSRAGHGSRKLAFISRSLILCHTLPSDDGSSPEEKYGSSWDGEPRSCGGKCEEALSSAGRTVSSQKPPQGRPLAVLSNPKRGMRRTFSIKVRSF
uniref:Uncharacterized protein n=1 Tax=Scleropages formosus TaxID=113540 RepID=A0A8C9T3I3_SCLFO